MRGCPTHRAHRTRSPRRPHRGGDATAVSSQQQQPRSGSLPPVGWRQVATDRRCPRVGRVQRKGSRSLRPRGSRRRALPASPWPGRRHPLSDPTLCRGDERYPRERGDHSDPDQPTGCSPRAAPTNTGRTAAPTAQIGATRLTCRGEPTEQEDAATGAELLLEQERPCEVRYSRATWKQETLLTAHDECACGLAELPSCQVRMPTRAQHRR